MLTYILFLIGFVFLIKGADLLVDGSSSLAKRFKIPDIVIGLTIVALGTSAPELIVNIMASFKGASGIAIGNILGSNIANILLILGISSIIFPLVVKKATIWKEIPFSLLGVLSLFLLVNDEFLFKANSSFLSRFDGLLLLLFFGYFIYYTFSIVKKKKDIPVDEDIKIHSNLKSSIYILVGLFGLALGGSWIVNGAVVMASNFGVSQSLIGLTIVAVGTSLPELATSAVAAFKRKPDIAVGNVVGSNIFNIFWILGISSLIRPIPFSSSSNFDIFVVIGATIVLFLVMFVGKKKVIEKWQGVLFVLTYVAYIAFLVIRG
uniref:Calcium/sodium antiporter n=1 Tax=candidate division CPR3 bacterium TaxID=2268181 RepID=A0A7C4R5D9_UNCC3